jgi:hypothetical protein
MLLSMKSGRQLSAFFLGAALALMPAFAAGVDDNSNQQGAGQAGVKQDVKTAGKDTKNAAQDAGHGVANGSKKAYNATARVTKKVWSKTKNTTKGAVDGGKDGAKQQ